MNRLRTNFLCVAGFSHFYFVIVLHGTRISKKYYLPDTLAPNGELEAQMFNLTQMANRITNAQFSTSAPILPNPC